MKPVLIQNLIRHNKNRKPRELERADIDHIHGGHKDRSGFLVLLILILTILLGLAFS